jgi:4-amino-4-deoxy-L-arabinose transferase-like glycosyltransferase
LERSERQASLEQFKWARWPVICWIVVFWRLGWLSLLDPDEAHYAQLTHEMLARRSWFVPLLDGKPFIDKPVLFHWLQAGCVSLFGETEFALRVPSACAALMLFVITRWVGVTLFGDEVGEWGALMLATIPATFALSSVGLFDMVFTGFLFGAVSMLLIAALQQRPRLQYIGFVLLALAVMTKGPVALLLVGLFVALGCVTRRGRVVLSRVNWTWGLMATAVCAAPWFVWMSAHFGSAFLNGYWLAGNLWYWTRPAHFSSRQVSYTFYVRAFVGAFFPWSTVTVGRAVDLIRRWGDDTLFSDSEILLWTWAITVVGFFSAARFKLDHYIFPAAPALCLLAANAWRAAIRDRRLTLTRVSIVVMEIAFIVVGVLMASVMFCINLDLPAGAIVVPAALIVGGSVALAQTIRRSRLQPPDSLGVFIVVLLIVFATTVVVGFPVFERTRPITFAARFLRIHTTPGDRVALYRLERWRASLRYYVGRPIERLDDVGAVQQFLASSSSGYIVMVREEYEELRRLGVVLEEAAMRPAVTATTGVGLRRQVWTQLVIARRRIGVVP